jgi:HAD superfamily hydrolase (TIGR01509 family)
MTTIVRAVLWDLDGTIVDSGDLHWHAFQETMAGESIALTYEEFASFFGWKNDRILTRLLGPDASPKRITRLGHEKEMAFRRLAAERGVQALPGAAEWIARLRADGWRQSIASSAPRDNITAMLAALGLTDAFDGIVAAEDVSTGKPDPEVFLTAAARLGAAPGTSIVVEDAEAGVEGARRAGMKSIGVSRLTTLPADVFVRSLTELDAGAFAQLIGVVSGDGQRRG